MALTEVDTKGIKNASIKLEDIENGTSTDAGKFLKNNDGAAPSWATVSTDLVADTSPQLGGDLDTNDFEIALDDGHAVKFGADNDLIIKEHLGAGFITARTGGLIYLGAGSSSNMMNIGSTDVTIVGECKLPNGNDLEITFGGNIILEEHSSGTSGGSVQFRERAANGSNFVGIKGPLDMGSASSYTITLPTATPTTGQVLKSSSTATTLEWGDAGAGAVGGGTDKIFHENGQTVTTNYTVGDTFGAAANAMSAGPITINNGVTVTINNGETWTIV